MADTYFFDEGGFGAYNVPSQEDTMIEQKKDELGLDLLLAEAVQAAGYTFCFLRAIQFDVEKGDEPKDIVYHDKILASVRERYSWIDEVADKIEASLEDNNDG